MASMFAVIIGTIMLMIAIVALQLYRAQKRMQDMRALAARLGYQYAAADSSLLGALSPFGLFSRGHAQTATNALRTEVDGAAVTAMDYSYTVGHGKNRHTYKQSVLLLETPRLDLPIFALRPEGVGSKLLGLLGQQDIDFEDQPEFSAAYVLQGPDEAAIRALFAGGKLASFARRPGLCLEGRGHRLLYYRPGRLVAPEEIQSFVGAGLEVMSLLATREEEPAYLAGLDEVLDELGVDEDDGSGTSPAS